MFYEPLIGWTKLLYDAYPELDLMPEGDWDGNGQIEFHEIIDTNLDSYIDESEARQFILSGTGRDFTAFRIPFGDFVAESGFSPENPIHDYILYDLQVKQMPDEDIRTVYSELGRIFDYVKARYNEEMTPEEKLLLVRNAMVENGAVFGESTDTFSEAVMWNTFDCDTGFHVLAAVAYELGWPVNAVHAPEHIFARWNEGEVHVNFEIQNGAFHSNDYYYSWLKIDPVSVSQEVYLVDLTQQQLQADYIAILSAVYQESQLLNEAEELVLTALDDWNTNPALFSWLGTIELHRENYELAMEYFNLSLALDPNSLNFHLRRIYTQIKLGYLCGLSEEIESLSTLLDRPAAVEGDYLLRVEAITDALAIWSEQYRNAPVVRLIDDLQYKLVALSGELNNRFYYSRGSDNYLKKNFSEAVWDFSLALFYDPEDKNARYYRAFAYFYDKDYGNAIADFSILVNKDIDTNIKSNLYGLMAACSLKLGNFEDAAEDIKKARELAPEFYVRFEDSAETREYARQLGLLLPDFEIQFI